MHTRPKCALLDTAIAMLPNHPRPIWCHCKRRCILAPPGATERTRYTCPACCDRILGRRKEAVQHDAFLYGGPGMDWAINHLSTR